MPRRNQGETSGKAVFMQDLLVMSISMRLSTQEKKQENFI
jgi:hypothetical protein